MSPSEPPAGPQAETKEAGSRSVWATLSSSVLSPVPALIYLVAFVVGIPAIAWMQSGPEPPIVEGPKSQILPPAVLVPGEITLHRAPGAGTPAPLEFELPRIGELAQLSLRTNIDRKDIQDPEASFAVRILAGDKPIWSQITDGVSFSRSRELTLLVETKLLEIGMPHVVEIRFLKPGDPLHDEVLFRRSIRAR